MSKITNDRPMFVPYSEYAENYRRTFQAAKQHKKCSVCGMPLDTIMEEPCDRPDCPFKGDKPDDSLYD